MTPTLAAAEGEEDTLEAREADVRRRHMDGEYGGASLEVLLQGTRAQWAREHPPPSAEAGGASAFPRLVCNEGTVDNKVMAVTKPARVGSLWRIEKIAVSGLLEGRRDLVTWRESIEPQLEIVGLKFFADDDVVTPHEANVELQAEFRVAHLLTFMAISHCCSPMVEVALNACQAFVDMQPSGDVHHVRGFNGNVALQGEAGKKVLIPDVLYVPGVQANLVLVGQLKESGVKLQVDGDKLQLVLVAGDVLGRAHYTGRVLCTDLHPCLTKSTSVLIDVVALRTIASATKSTPDMWHARLAHVSVDTIKSSEKQEVATDLVIKPSAGTDLLCVSCVGGKLARHTFPHKGSDAEEPLAVVHIDLCGPFRVAAKDGSVYLILLKNQKAHFMWVKLVAKKSDVLQLFEKWLSEAVWVRNSLEQSTLQPGMTLHQLLTGKKPDLTLACVWGCMVQFVVPEQQRGGKLAPKARWGLHFEVSLESKGWEVLDLADNKLVTTVEAIFYETMLLEVWKVKYGPASGRAPVIPPTLASSGSVLTSPAPTALLPAVPSTSPLVADLPKLTSLSAIGTKGRIVAAPDHGIAGGRRDEVHLGAQVIDDRGADTRGANGRGAVNRGAVVEVARGADGGREVGRGADIGTVYNVDYDKTYAPVRSYITLSIFLNIVIVLELHLMQLDMKNDFLQSKLDQVLYMYQPNYYDDGTSRVCKLLKRLYGLKQSPLLWYSALDDVLTGAGWRKSQVDEPLYFKVADDDVAC
ncbi:unnamed protein product [Closterium sp. NIES-54]